MKKLFCLLMLVIAYSFLSVLAQDATKSSKQKENTDKSKYLINITINDIPKGQQTLFIPIKIDSMVLDFDAVSMEDLSKDNILAVASTSKEKVGTGIGLLKLDNKGLPSSLSFKVYLKPVGSGQTDVSLSRIAAEPALLAKGTVLVDSTIVGITSESEVEVFEKEEKGKKKLLLSQGKISLDIQRSGQKEETIFIPIIFNGSVIDLDETFGHAIVNPGIAVKSFSSGSLHEGGPGVEIKLSDVAEKDFSIDVDLVPRKIGKSTFTCATPQIGHTALVKGPIVNISPSIINVASVPDVVTGN